MQDFSVDVSIKSFGCPFFVVRIKFYYRQSLEIWGNYSKICSKIIQNLEKLSRTCLNGIVGDIFQFSWAICGKIRIYINIEA